MLFWKGEDIKAKVSLLIEEIMGGRIEFEQMLEGIIANVCRMNISEEEIE